MKKLLLLSLLLFILPTLSWAENDSCSYPEQYTVDKRCYVTEEQKGQRPYNAVVGVLDNDRIVCTGTVVDIGHRLFMYTAKHCVFDDNGSVKSVVNIRTQDGKTVTADIKEVGFFKLSDKYLSDNVVYFIPEGYVDGEYIPLVDGTRADCTGWTDKYEYGGGFLFTVYKECVLDDDGESKAVITIKDKNNQELKIGRVYEYMGDNRIEQDWAVYVVNGSVPATGIANSSRTERVFGGVREVGYSPLKIMSDAEIDEFKQKYIKYLEKEVGIKSDGTEIHLGWYRGGINLNAMYVRDYLGYLEDNETSYFQNVFRDTVGLKFSTCNFCVDSSLCLSLSEKCQSWGIKASAGIFDKYDNLMGIYQQERETLGTAGEYMKTTGLSI